MKGLWRNMPLIDTHVHIDFFSDPIKIATAYENLKIYTMFVTNLPEIFEKHYPVFQKYKYVRLCLGYHPQIANEFQFDKHLFSQLAKKTKYIGEVGLDFSNESKETILKQIEAFEYITSPKFNNGRIYSIHSKGTEDHILDILVRNKVKHAILHWYTGKLTTLDKLVDNGFYFSLNPKMLATKNGAKVINRIPTSRILFETDAPLAKFNNKVIVPSRINSIYDSFNQVVPGFKENVFKNFKRLLVERDLAEY